MFDLTKADLKTGLVQTCLKDFSKPEIHWFGYIKLNIRVSNKFIELVISLRLIVSIFSIVFVKIKDT